MFIHRPIALAMIESLSRIFDQNWLADREIERIFKANKKWGAKDRAQFAKVVYDITRYYRKFAYLTGNDSLPKDRLGKNRFRDLIQAYFTLNDIETNLDFERTLDKSKLLRSWEGVTDPAIRHSVPNWLFEFGVSQLGKEQWINQLEQMNYEAPFFIRTNELKTNRDDLIKALSAEGIEAIAVPGSAVALQLPRSNVFKTESFKNGYFEVQDIHSQKVSDILDPKPGERIIDACAGGGGKTLHIAALMKNKGQLVAMDTHSKKLENLKLRARRAGVFNTEVRVIEGSKDVKRLKASADRLLLDVPCTGSGVFRRNPDARWRLTLDKIENLQKIQLEILTEYSSMLKPGGTLVYSTCSLFPCENQEVVTKFLSQNETTFSKAPEDTNEAQLWCSKDGGDGFYFCKLIKNKS